jgi:hypothetical protein
VRGDTVWFAAWAPTDGNDDAYGYAIKLYSGMVGSKWRGGCATR